MLLRQNNARTCPPVHTVQEHSLSTQCKIKSTAQKNRTHTTSKTQNTSNSYTYLTMLGSIFDKFSQKRTMNI